MPLPSSDTVNLYPSASRSTFRLTSEAACLKALLMTLYSALWSFSQSAKSSPETEPSW